MEILILLGVVVFVTVVGHGLWVVAAAMLRALFGGGQESMPAKGPVGFIDLAPQCAGCGARVGVGDTFCLACGRPQGKGNTDLAELTVTQRRIEQFRVAEQIDAETYRLLTQLINEEQAQLKAPKRAPAAPPVAARETRAQTSVPTAALAPPPTREFVPPPPPLAPIQSAPMFNAAPASEPTPAADDKVQPPEPRRSFAEMLTAFMEESSIRWGELVGGLLIIGCSLALVVSLWAEIAERPLLKFSVFTGVTAALFGLGFYSAHRWKLPTTSRGVLLTSTLLVPLNFLAVAAFGRSAGGVLATVGELFSFALFAALVFYAGRVIAPQWPSLLVGGAMGPAAAMLLAKHGGAILPGWLTLGVAALAAWLVVTALLLRRTRVFADIGEDEAHDIFTLTGVSAFAAWLPFGLLLAGVGNFGYAVRSHAPLTVLSGVPLLAVGLLMWLRVKSAETATLRTAGTSIGIIGAGLMAVGVLLAWPNVRALLVVLILNAVVFAAVDWYAKLKPARALAFAHLLPAWLLGGQLLAGRIAFGSEDGAQLFRALTSASAGASLIGLFALLLMATELWPRAERRKSLEIGALVTAAISLLLITAHGFGRAGDPHWATLGYAAYAAAALWWAWRRDEQRAAWTGAALLCATAVQLFVFKFAGAIAHPWQRTLLGYAGVMLGAAVLLARNEKARRLFTEPFGAAALAASAAVVPMMLINADGMTAGQFAAHCFWLAALWLLIALMREWVAVFSAFEIALTVGAVCAVKAALNAFDGAAHWLDERPMQATGVTLALMSIGWIALRLRNRARLAGEAPPHGPWTRLLSEAWRVDYGATLLAFAALAFSVPAAFLNSDPRSRDWGVWLPVAAVTGALLMRHWERFSRRAVWLTVVTGVCAALLLAAQWQPESATMATLRWSLAGYLLLASALIWARARLTAWGESLGWPQLRERSAGLAWQTRALSLALTVPPILLMTANAALSSATENVTTQIGPLMLIAATLLGHAVRERSAGFACAAGLMMNATVTFGYGLRGPLNDAAMLRLVQLNVLTTALCSLVWVGVRRLRHAEDDAPLPELLKLQAAVAAIVSLSLVALADVWIVSEPQQWSGFVAQVGGGWNWAATAAALLAFAATRTGVSLNADRVAIGALTLGSLIACSLMRGAANGWLSYHALLATCAVTAWAMTIWRGRHTEPRSELWAASLGVLAVSLALVATNAPGGAWRAVVAVAAMSVMAAALAWVTRRSGYLYAAGALGNLGAMVWVVSYSTRAGALFDLLRLNVIVLAVPSIAWLLIELKLRRTTPARAGNPALPFHQFAAMAATTVMFGLMCLSLLADAAGAVPMTTSLWLNAGALAATAALLIACLWDEQFEYRWLLLYVVGLTAAGSALDLANLNVHGLLTFGAAALATYSLATGGLWRGRARIEALLDRVGIARGNDEQRWLAAANCGLSVIGWLCAARAAVVVAPLGWRLLAAGAALVGAAAIALSAQGERRLRLQTWALALGFAALVVMGWAWLTPGASGNNFNRLVIAMCLATAAAIAWYGGWSAQLAAWENDWAQAARRVLPFVSTTAFIVLSLLFAGEFADYSRTGAVWMRLPAVIAMSATIIAWALSFLAFALLPGRDPFNWDERGRMRYVYGAEVLLVLLVMHARLTLPWLFGGCFSSYWPLFVMLLAFAGVGLSEVFARRRRLVLAEPLERTGVLMPLLPVLGFWFFKSEVNYSGVLLLVGLFYGVLSVLRQSFGFGLLAAVAGNGGLWHWLNTTADFRFFEHPQLWLIPAALSVLAAAHFNRAQLSQQQLTTIRYTTLMTIYVSSTADIFIAGAAGSAWLPLVLAALSVAGVLGGMLLRVRAYLFLGASFLLLAVVTMIRQASVNLGWTWLWYVAGIAFGVLIISTFALFERKRSEMMLLVERLKQWQA